MIIDNRLLDDALFEEFGKVHLADFGCGIFGRYLCHIVLHHELYELLEGGSLWVPAEFALCLGWVAPEVDYIGWTIEIFADLDELLADECLRSGNAYAYLIEAFATELKGNACVLESEVGELTNRVLHACGNDEIFWGLVLEDEPHALNIVLGITPVAE